MSSSASTFDGSAVATSSVRSPEKAIGIVWWRLADAVSISVAALRSTSKTLRSTWSRPLRSASARESWSESSTPPSIRIWPVVLPASRALLTAASTASASAKPRSTITSPIRRFLPVRCVGGVRPGIAGCSRAAVASAGRLGSPAVAAALDCGGVTVTYSAAGPPI